MKKEKYMPPLMTITAVDMQEVLLGVSYTYIRPIEDDVNALGHEVGGEYEFGYKNGVGSGSDGNGNSWGISWE